MFLFRECNCKASETLIIAVCHPAPFWLMISLHGVDFSALFISWMDIPSSKEAITPARGNSFSWQRGSNPYSAHFEDWILPVFNLFCLSDIFSAFYYLIYFLVFCLAFRLDRSFVNRYFVIHIQFDF